MSSEAMVHRISRVHARFLSGKSAERLLTASGWLANFSPDKTVLTADFSEVSVKGVAIEELIRLFVLLFGRRWRESAIT